MDSIKTNESPGFSIRSGLIAIALSLFLLASSTYIALKFGLLPWPIIFSVVASGGFLKLINRGRNVDIHEINCGQAGASIGGLIAGGIAFTLPGIIYLNDTKGLDIPWPSPWLFALLVVSAGLLGILFSIPLKYKFVDEEQLPYPAGTAGAELLLAGKAGGRQLQIIIAAAAAAGIFSLLRDVFFPGGWSVASLAQYGIFLVFLPMPILMAGGFILGPRSSFSWFAGAVVGWILLVPLLINSGVTTESAKAIAQNTGMGMVLGSGIGFFLIYVLPRLKNIFEPFFEKKRKPLKWLWVIPLAGIAALLFSKVPLPAAVLTLAGVWLMVSIAARMTGETNIDPLEQFGIFVGLLISAAYAFFQVELSLFASFMIVSFVSIACAIAGDAGHDFKSASIVGTRFFDIVKIDIIAIIASGLGAPLVLSLLRSGFAQQLFTEAMPAPQAKLVAGSIFGFEHPVAFKIGFAAALAGELINRQLPEKFKSKLLLMPMGIGLFLGLGLAIPLAIGAAMRWYIDRDKASLYHAGVLLAAGVMGGEGIAGFGAGALTVFGFSYKTAAFSLIGIFVIILVLTLIQRLKRE